VIAAFFGRRCHIGHLKKQVIVERTVLARRERHES